MSPLLATTLPWVQFAAGRVVANRGDMHPGHEPVVADHRLTCIGAEAHDVGSAHSLLSGLNRVCPGIGCRELLSMGEVARCNADLGERADAGKHLQMRTTLHASADNR